MKMEKRSNLIATELGENCEIRMHTLSNSFVGDNLANVAAVAGFVVIDA